MSDDALAERYGTPPRWRRTAVVAGSAVVAVAFLAWLTWTALFHSNPDAESELVGFDTVDEHRVEVRVRVSLSDRDVEASCRVRAFADDHTPVGDLSWDPTAPEHEDGAIDDLTVRTDRRATSVELVGCTTPDQPRPR